MCFFCKFCTYSVIYIRFCIFSRDLNNKRTNFLDWDDYFMSVAFLASMRSKDPCTQVGACIVNEDKKIVGVGYNGMPIGCNDDDFSWKKANESELDSKFLYGKLHSSQSNSTYGIQY